MRAFLAAARVGLKEMAGDWRRFTLLIICLAVGTALISGVSSVSSAITRAVDQNAAMLMGGDLEFTRSDRAATASEIAAAPISSSSESTTTLSSAATVSSPKITSPKVHSAHSV